VRWFLNLSTSGKLYTSFGLMVVLLAVVAAAAYRSIVVIQESHRALYEQEFSDVLDIKAVRANQVANRADLLSMMVPGSRTELGALEKTVRERVKGTDESMRRLLERNQSDAGNLKKLQEFESLRQSSLQTREAQTLPLIRAGQLEEARQLHLGMQAAKDAQMEAIADAFLAQTEQAARAALERSGLAARDSMRAFLVAGIVAVLLAVAMTLLLNRVIAHPLKGLSAAAERVAAGDLSVDVPTDGRADETGTLLQTFARMLASLRETTRDLSTEKRLLHNLMDSVPDAIFFKDRQHRFLRINRVHAAILGVQRPEDAVGRPTSDFFPPDEARQRDAEDDEILRTAKPLPDKVRRINQPGGKVRWSSTTKAPIKDENGQVTGLVGIARNVTERQRLQEELREREAGLRRAQLLAKLAHVITLPDGSFESWSETLPQLIAVDIARMPKSTREWLNIVHPDDRQKFREKAIETGATGERFDLEYRLRRGDGAWIDVRQVSEPMQSEANAKGRVRWFGTLQDVTEQKAAEARIQRLNRVYAVLSGINTLIVRERDREQLLRDACRIAVEAGKLRFVWIGAVDDKAMQLTPVAWAGEEQDFLATVRGRLSLRESDSQGRSLVAQAAVAKEALISNDVANDPRIRFKQEHAQRGIRSLAAFPLMLSDKVVGVVALHAAEPGFFDHEEVRLLTELVGDISFGLEHIDKEQKLERLNRVYAVLSGINTMIVRVRDRDELFRESCRIAIELGRFGLVYVGLVDDAAQQIRPVAWAGDHPDLAQRPRPLGPTGPGREGTASQAIRTKRAVVENSITPDSRTLTYPEEVLKRGYRSVGSFPLVVDERAVGVLGLFAGEPGYFDAQEIKLLEELAGDIAFALEHIEKEEKLDYLAYYDSITGLANRTFFHERLEQYVREASRGQRRLAVLMVDIERFRTINDSFGRRAGDELLKQMAARFLELVAEPSEVAHLGADHFAVVIPDVQLEADLARIMDRARERLVGKPFSVAGTELRIATKAGIALFPSDGSDAETLLRNAEAALQKAKASGERHVFYAPEMNERVAEKLSLENKLHRALEKNEFVLHYQPKVDLDARKIVGVEALIRWQSPELGLVPPGRFIPLLEETGLILEVGSWALTRAALDHRAWTEMGIKPLRVAVNVSAIQLRQRDFVEIVERAVKEGVVPVGIDLEITESLVMEDVESTIEKLKRVQALGIKIAIDDFGTGYSSLAYLAKLPVETLKIDRSFVITMLKDIDTATLVQTVITLAHSLKLTVVAEGVDAEEQAKVLRLLRCDQMQGYLFSKPLPLDQMTALLKAKPTA
jgi:diguanylate cyclase (GGDEF)-like protein/PAS domain S-box-containing protein